MEAVFLELIKQLNSSVFALIAILLVIFWLIYRAGNITESFSAFKTNNNKNEENINRIKDSLAEISATTKLLYEAHLSTVKSNSPMNLTTKGVDVAENINADSTVSEHWSEIKKEFLQAGDPNNPYDIQIISMNIAKNCYDSIFTEEERNKIKLYAFNKGMNLLEIYPVIGIIIRNKILGEKGIEINEIDKHDPKKSPKAP
ncbi:MAG: hypothetical protein ABI721_05565 [Candidatus Dojkabacteria bacterium]